MALWVGLYPRNLRTLFKASQVSVASLVVVEEKFGTELNIHLQLNSLFRAKVSH
ncbi:MAG: hypothetical protein MJK10_11875 [Pseudomonadales bacterium]|nr:hypothetical protein [Pseudomonadales bacterium]NRA16689.1 hypothetical protein [Oceanospirillaceae bacterium]